MNTKQDVQDFVAQKTLAMVGVSRDPQSFSQMAYKELKGKGYRLFPVNPNATSIGEDPCFASVASLPERPGGAVIFTSPSETEKVARELVAAGVTRLWIQQGAQSEAVIKYCTDQALPAVWKRCILMFAEPVGALHGIHRWFAKVFGTLPR